VVIPDTRAFSGSIRESGAETREFRDISQVRTAPPSFERYIDTKQHRLESAGAITNGDPE